MKLKVLGLLLFTTALMLSVGCGGETQTVSTAAPTPTTAPTPAPSEVVVRKAIVEQLVEANEYVDSFKEGVGNTQPLPDIEATISPMPTPTPYPTYESVSTPTELYQWFAPAVPVVITPTDRMGSGIVIAEGEYVLTAAHVVAGETTVMLQGPNWETVASVVNYDIEASDLALLKPHSPIKLAKYPELEVSRMPSPGGDVVALGFPQGGSLGTSSATLTRGVISAIRNLNGHSVIQFDAAINPGNSGGPLFSLDGKVIGIVSSKLMDDEGIGFAISSTSYTKIEQKLQQPRSVAEMIKTAQWYLTFPCNDGYEGAQRELNLAINLEPSSGSLYLQRALVHRRCGPKYDNEYARTEMLDLIEAINLSLASNTSADKQTLADAYIERAEIAARNCCSGGWSVLTDGWNIPTAPDWRLKENARRKPDTESGGGGDVAKKRQFITNDYASALLYDPDNVAAHFGKALNHIETANDTNYSIRWSLLTKQQQDDVYDQVNLAIEHLNEVIRINPSNELLWDHWYPYQTSYLRAAYWERAYIYRTFGNVDKCESDMVMFKKLKRNEKDDYGNLWIPGYKECLV